MWLQIDCKHNPSSIWSGKPGLSNLLGKRNIRSSTISSSYINPGPRKSSRYVRPVAMRQPGSLGIHHLRPCLCMCVCVSAPRFFHTRKPPPIGSAPERRPNLQNREPAGTCEPVLEGDGCGRPPFCFFALTHSRPALSCLSRRRPPPSSSPKKPRKVQRVRPSIFQVPPLAPSLGNRRVCARARPLTLSLVGQSETGRSASIHMQPPCTIAANVGAQTSDNAHGGGRLYWLVPGPETVDGVGRVACTEKTRVLGSEREVSVRRHVVDPPENYSRADAIRAIKEDHDVEGAFHGCAGIIPNSRNLGKTNPSCINLSRKGEDPLNRFFICSFFFRLLLIWLNVFRGTTRDELFLFTSHRGL